MVSAASAVTKSKFKIVINKTHYTLNFDT